MTHILLTLILATLITQGGFLFAALRRLAVIEELLLDDLDDDVAVIPAHDLPEELQDTIAEYLRSFFGHPSMRNRHPENDDGPGFL